ncbi:MAG: hypothetical protein KKB02_10645 [Alphaproteobacteria bacterium]|nr:hypothetical protein [Alphaproteobacteria bacterium]
MFRNTAASRADGAVRRLRYRCDGRPDRDGLDPTADHPAAFVPIIAMTANVLPHQIAMFGKSSLNGFVTKPFRGNALLEKVAECVGASVCGQDSQEPAIDTCDSMTMHDLMGNPKMDQATRELRHRVDEVFDADPATHERLISVGLNRLRFQFCAIP